jgi:predicted GNAT superfamily acetyltransferase
MTTVTIRPLVEMSEVEHVETIQREAWGMTDLEIMPSRLMNALRHNGAALLGAYDGDRCVGFVLGVLATVEGLTDRIDQVAAARLQMYSVIMGVLPEYQDKGVGYQLKLAQRDFANRIGVRLITWTYDPLEGRNARLNISKLGAVCQRYIRDYHGTLGGINAGISTDRFHIDWWITSNRVNSRVSANSRRPLSLDAFIGGGALLLNETTFDQRGLPIPAEHILDSNRSILLAEIPADFQALKKQDFDLAVRWRAHGRLLFEHIFQLGYLITDFVYDKGSPTRPPRSFYVLTTDTVRG